MGNKGKNRRKYKGKDIGNWISKSIIKVLTELNKILIMNIYLPIYVYK